MIEEKNTQENESPAAGTVNEVGEVSPIDEVLRNMLADLQQELREKSPTAEAELFGCYMRVLRDLGDAFVGVGAILGIPVVAYQLVPLSVIRETAYLGEAAMEAVSASTTAENAEPTSVAELLCQNFDTLAPGPTGRSRAWRALEALAQRKSMGQSPDAEG